MTERLIALGMSFRERGAGLPVAEITESRKSASLESGLEKEDFRSKVMDLEKEAPCSKVMDLEKEDPRALDLGAGAGDSLPLLEKAGFQAVGIDKNPGPGREGQVFPGDFLHCPWEAERFDLVFSECALFCSGDLPGALKEARRLLKPGGLLLVGDVWFSGIPAWEETLKAAGFQLLSAEDITREWREYYLSCVWNGTAEEWNKAGCGFSGKDCRYYLTAARAR